MLNFFLDAAAGATDAVAQEGGLMAQLSFPLMLVAMIAVFYFLMIRPQKKQEKEAQEMRDSLAVGDEVTTIGGIIGRVVNVKEETFVLETTKERTRIRFERSAIKRIDRKFDAPEADSPAEETTEENK